MDGCLVPGMVANSMSLKGYHVLSQHRLNSHEGFGGEFSEQEGVKSDEISFGVLSFLPRSFVDKTTR